jgi:hypothetical protein
LVVQRCGLEGQAAMSGALAVHDTVSPSTRG